MARKGITMHSGESSNEEITTIVARHILPGKEKLFDNWMHRIATAAEQQPGFVSISVITPAKEASVRYVVYKFRDETTLQAWENSETKQAFLLELKQYATQHAARKTGLETWFTLKEHDLKAPPKWKMALAALSGVYIISIILRLLFTPLTTPWSLYASTLFYGGITVATLTWIYMPSFTKLFKKWLYPEK